MEEECSDVERADGEEVPIPSGVAWPEDDLGVPVGPSERARDACGADLPQRAAAPAFSRASEGRPFWPLY